MNFSIILSSRCRANLLEASINSIFENAKNPELVEVLVRYDDDDEGTDSYLSALSTTGVRSFKEGRPTNLIQEFNKLAEKSKGKLVLAWNDDALMLTKNWDQIVLEKSEAFCKSKSITDSIFLCSTSDTSCDKPQDKPGYSSFMIITKEAIAALGYYMKEDFVTLGADSHINRIYREVDRIVDCSEVLIDHVLHKTVMAVVSPDQVAAEYRAKTRCDPFTFDISEDVSKLRSKINS